MTEYPRGGVAANAPAAPTAAITAAANILLRASRGQSSHIRAGRHKPVAAMTATDLGFYFGGRGAVCCDGGVYDMKKLPRHMTMVVSYARA